MHVELPAKLLNCLLRSNKSNINQFGVSLFIYVGLHTSTRKYEDIACRSWEYMHTCIDLLRMFMGQIQSFKQCYVYNDIQIDVCFEMEKGELNLRQNTKHTARKTQIDRQVEKKTYTHHIDSWRQANREGLCERETETIIGKAPKLYYVLTPWNRCELFFVFWYAATQLARQVQQERTQVVCSN